MDSAVVFSGLFKENGGSFLPFQYIYFAPISIYIEKYGTAEVLGILGKQLFWIVLFGTVCYLVWKKAIYKIVIQGADMNLKIIGHFLLSAVKEQGGIPAELFSGNLR